MPADHSGTVIAVDVGSPADPLFRIQSWDGDREELTAVSLYKIALPAHKVAPLDTLEKFIAALLRDHQFPGPPLPPQIDTTGALQVGSRIQLYEGGRQMFDGVPEGISESQQTYLFIVL